MEQSIDVGSGSVFKHMRIRRIAFIGSVNLKCCPSSEWLTDFLRRDIFSLSLLVVYEAEKIRLCFSQLYSILFCGSFYFGKLSNIHTGKVVVPTVTGTGTGTCYQLHFCVEVS